MQFSAKQKAILFWLLLALGTISAFVHLYYFHDAYTNDKDLSAFNTAFGAAGIGAFGVLLVKLMKMAFFEDTPLSDKDLRGYFEDRKERLNDRRKTQDPSTSFCPETTLRPVIDSNLKLLMDALKKLFGENRYEISVFSNREEPEIIFYRDTEGSTTPRSHQERADNPTYYIDKNYEAIQILNDFSTELIPISNTSKRAKYEFADDDQKSKVRSTILKGFRADDPKVFVIATDKAGLFKKTDDRTEKILTVIINSIEADIELNHYLDELVNAKAAS